MPINFASALVFIAGLVIGGGTTALYLQVLRLEQRIRQLEQASAKRLPYKSADEIEDATAALIALKSALDLRSEFVDNAFAHLQKARNPELNTKK